MRRRSLRAAQVVRRAPQATEADEAEHEDAEARHVEQAVVLHLQHVPARGPDRQDAQAADAGIADTSTERAARRGAAAPAGADAARARRGGGRIGRRLRTGRHRPPGGQRPAVARDAAVGMHAPAQVEGARPLGLVDALLARGEAGAVVGQQVGDQRTHVAPPSRIAGAGQQVRRDAFLARRIRVGRQQPCAVLPAVLIEERRIELEHHDAIEFVRVRRDHARRRIDDDGRVRIPARQRPADAIDPVDAVRFARPLRHVEQLRLQPAQARIRQRHERGIARQAVRRRHQQLRRGAQIGAGRRRLALHVGARHDRHAADGIDGVGQARQRAVAGFAPARVGDVRHHRQAERIVGPAEVAAVRVRHHDPQRPLGLRRHGLPHRQQQQASGVEAVARLDERKEAHGALAVFPLAHLLERHLRLQRHVQVPDGEFVQLADRHHRRPQRRLPHERGLRVGPEHDFEIAGERQHDDRIGLLGPGRHAPQDRHDVERLLPGQRGGWRRDLFDHLAHAAAALECLRVLVGGVAVQVLAHGEPLAVQQRRDLVLRALEQQGELLGGQRGGDVGLQAAGDDAVRGGGHGWVVVLVMHHDILAHIRFKCAIFVGARVRVKAPRAVRCKCGEDEGRR